MLHLFKQCETLVKFGHGCGQREAYVTLTDLLVVFARQLRQNQLLASLVYQPQPSLQKTLQVQSAKYIALPHTDRHEGFICCVTGLCDGLCDQQQ